ncbi:hypothetical protein AVEN_219616-1 [Araneus ventricosus]|uniref:Uncharacterized protein n=1 Tax=Araneus ventricosus TaxID=182803 RepID=A0A4Y2R9L0_ARAVE|nr:hypothetical protein AVEN_219616-1 [Araneus ventricosus]
MGFLAQGTIEDLKALADYLGINAHMMTFLNKKDLIIKDASYETNFCKSRLAFIISERKAEETLQRDQRDNERLYKLEKLKIQAEQTYIGAMNSSEEICRRFLL